MCTHCPTQLLQCTHALFVPCSQMATPVMPEYVWLVVVGAFGAFGFGWGTGANDVANAFGTSVGSKTLTLRQAVIIAAIFSFSGALLLGRVVTNTIAGVHIRGA
jgi:sodium-dependent phosphate transporter